LWFFVVVFSGRVVVWVGCGGGNVCGWFWVVFLWMGGRLRLLLGNYVELGVFNNPSTWACVVVAAGIA
jgi:hypothetical protein